jgi:hypothetical protein
MIWGVMGIELAKTDITPIRNLTFRDLPFVATRFHETGVDAITKSLNSRHTLGRGA